MAIAFCPLCNSMMKEGICTNKNCGNSQFEIDFIKVVNEVKKLPQKFLKIINNSYINEIELFENHMSFKKSDDIWGQFLKYNADSADKIPNVIDGFINELLNLNIPLSHKIIGMSDSGEVILSNIRHSTIKTIKRIPKSIINKKIYKHYFEFIQISSLKKCNALNGDDVFATNDFKNWVSVGEYYYSGKQINEMFLVNLYISLCHIVKKYFLWTLTMTDKKTNLSLKTYFEKEVAYELFRNREIKEGKKRRTALKHIVDEYEREKPKKTIVNEHFRGAMIFEWRGITFKLSPPILDEQRIELNKIVM